MKQRLMVIFIISQVCLFAGHAVAAERYPSVTSSEYTDFYGIVDQIYPQESRIIINDFSFEYNSGSSFFNENGARISGPGALLKTGMAVKYNVYSRKKALIIKKMEAISLSNYQKAMNSSRDER